MRLQHGVQHRRADEANTTAGEALDLQAVIDAREREFRAVDWDADIVPSTKGDALALTNIGDTPAISVTVVVHLSRERETHFLGDIQAKETVKVESARVTEWMVEAREHEVVHPGYRIHWSSPLGQVSDETKPLRDLGDFVDWEDQRS